MTADDILNKAIEMFGDALADFEVFPKVFLYQIKLAELELRTAK